MLIDLSKWNCTLDAAKAKQNGITGVILRASYGVTRDEMVAEYAARLKAAGIPVIGSAATTTIIRGNPCSHS